MHFIIRRLIVKTAWKESIDPDKLSYKHAYNVLRRKMTQSAAFPPEEMMNKQKVEIWENNVLSEIAAQRCISS
jgi:hypothetical protein